MVGRKRDRAIMVSNYQIEMRNVRESSIFRLNQIRNENKSVYIMEEINLLIKFNVGIN